MTVPSSLMLCCHQSLSCIAPARFSTASNVYKESWHFTGKFHATLFYECFIRLFPEALLAAERGVLANIS